MNIARGKNSNNASMQKRGDGTDIKTKKFIHHITASAENKNIIEKYNSLVDELKGMVNDKRKYMNFIRWIDKNVVHKDYIFHYYDLHTFLYQYI